MTPEDISQPDADSIPLLKRALCQDPASTPALWSLAKGRLGEPEEACGIGARLLSLGHRAKAMSILAVGQSRSASDAAWTEPAAELAERIASGRVSRTGWLRVLSVLESADRETLSESRRLAVALVAGMVQHPSPDSFEIVLSSMPRAFRIREMIDIVRLGTKLKDRRILPFATGLVNHYRTHTALPDRVRRTLARVCLYAILNIDGARALMAAQKSMDDPMVTKVFEAEFKGLCLICVGQVAEGIALAKDMPDDLGLLFNGVHLYPDPETVLAILRDTAIDSDLPATIEAPRRIGVFISCDDAYFRTFGSRYLANFRPPDGPVTEINFLVNGALSEEERAAAQTSAPCAVLFHIDPALSRDKTYYTLRRYMDLPEHIGRYDLSVITDIDSLVDLDSDAFKRTAFGAAFGWYDTEVEIPWLRHNCSLAYFSNTRLGTWSARAVAAIGKAIFTPRRDARNWYCDQVCLAAFWGALGEDIRKHVRHFTPETTREILRTYNALSLEAGQRMAAKVKSMEETAPNGT